MADNKDTCEKLAEKEQACVMFLGLIYPEWFCCSCSAEQKR